MKDLLTVKETSQFLRITRQALMLRVKYGDLPFYRIGKRVLFDKEELNEWLDKQKNKEWHK